MYKPTRLLSLGDFFDFASFSRFQLNPDLPSPSDEIDRAIESALPWYDAFPELDIVQSNHDARIAKKIFGAGLPERCMRRFGDIMKSPPGWDWDKFELFIDGVMYFHGEGLTHGSSKTAFNRFKCSVVHGHLHSQAHVTYSQDRRNRYFSCNAGALILNSAKQFDYAKHAHEKAVLAVAVIIDGERCILETMPEKMQNDLR